MKARFGSGAGNKRARSWFARFWDYYVSRNWHPSECHLSGNGTDLKENDKLRFHLPDEWDALKEREPSLKDLCKIVQTKPGSKPGADTTFTCLCPLCPDPQLGSFSRVVFENHYKFHEKSGAEVVTFRVASDESTTHKDVPITNANENRFRIIQLG